MKKFNVQDWVSVYIQPQDIYEYIKHLLHLHRENKIRRNSIKNEMDRLGYLLIRHGEFLTRTGKLLTKERFLFDNTPTPKLKLSQELELSLINIEPLILEAEHRKFIQIKDKDKKQATKKYISVCKLGRLCVDTP